MGNAQIVRIWRGRTRRSEANAYEHYLRETGFVGYSTTSGNRSVRMARREIGDLTEFCLITVWESWDAIRAFAGENPEQAVFYPDDDKYLVERDLTVQHYEVFAAS